MYNNGAGIGREFKSYNTFRGENISTGVRKTKSRVSFRLLNLTARNMTQVVIKFLCQVEMGSMALLPPYFHPCGSGFLRNPNLPALEVAVSVFWIAVEKVPADFVGSFDGIERALLSPCLCWPDGTPPLRVAQSHKQHLCVFIKAAAQAHAPSAVPVLAVLLTPSRKDMV
ncbi:unnamed protein product [Mesocestoides corti]|uniref:Uncharacterized protein n=1 Tax=Mesocestoides corti TaxID=53468 RepID=A0A0R3U542_MESCO|nr:unnamed protein product [Mesocestoides corti]